MRLWHYKIIPYLPKSQLVGQWRELNSIYKKRDNHILINYVYDYDKDYLYNYSCMVVYEMESRGYKINKWDNFKTYFNKGTEDYIFNTRDLLTFKEHNNEYLTICYYNLKEKYTRGQKDFTDDMWNRLHQFYYHEQTHNEVKQYD